MKKQTFTKPTVNNAMLYRKAWIIIAFLMLTSLIQAQSFVHPGLLHTQTDLDRMKDKVAQGAHPWIDGWNLLIQDPKAQSSYVGRPDANMNRRQLMSDDAIAAYLNAIRWYISGSTSHAQCAIGILNNYSNTVDQIPSGGNTDIDGLGGIGVAMMCNAAEIMKLYSGWSSGDINNFKSMMVNYFYPLRHEFLTNHRGSCISNYWANWDANNIAALLAIGVVADNRAIYSEGVDYFYNGAGNGSINNAVPYVHAGGLGQFQESGRDQDHAQLAVGLLADVCQIAWNQGDDLFAASNNRLLAGAEYVARYNLMQDVPFTTYNNCQPANHDWPAINARGRIHERPIWELLYNHYVVRQGLSAPFTQQMAEVVRPEGGSKDHLGYGSLTYTLEPSSFPPNPVPGVPLGLTATAGTSQVTLTWQPPSDLTANGYVIQRSISSDGGFSTIGTYNAYINTKYVDNNLTNGTTYYYRVAAVNQAGTGAYSAVSSARPLATGALPTGWNRAEIGSQNAGNATYANVSGGTFVVNSYGTDITGTIDNTTFVYRAITGDGSITGRITDISGTLARTGLMIRETLNDNSKAVAMTVGEGGWRFARMGYRTSTGGNTASRLGNTYTWRPAWFRIARSGNIFTAYESSDGETWFEVGSVNISMSSSYFIGLVACSGNATAMNTTVYDNITLTGSVGGDTALGTVSWESYNFADYFIRHQNAVGRIDPNVSPVDDKQWEMVTGLADPNGISFESVNFPGQYLRHSTNELVLDSVSNSSQQGDATFYIRDGLADVGWISFESYNVPGYYIRHSNYVLKIDQISGSTAEQDATFRQIGGILNGSVVQLKNRTTGLYLDGMGRTTNGSACGQWANTTSTNAQWTIQEYNGNYRVRNVSTDLYLDGMGRTSNGSACGQWANTTSANAQWRIEPFDGNYYRIQNVNTGLYLDGMGRTANGADCSQWANTSSTNAQWELVSISSSSKIVSSIKEESISSSTTAASSIVENSVKTTGIEVYPNPVSNKLTIQLGEDYPENTEITLHDTLGKLITSAKVKGKIYELDFSTISRGVYIITVISPETRVFRKIVKE